MSADIPDTIIDKAFSWRSPSWEVFGVASLRDVAIVKGNYDRTSLRAMIPFKTEARKGNPI